MAAYTEQGLPVVPESSRYDAGRTPHWPSSLPHNTKHHCCCYCKQCQEDPSNRRKQP